MHFSLLIIDSIWDYDVFYIIFSYSCFKYEVHVSNYPTIFDRSDDRICPVSSEIDRNLSKVTAGFNYQISTSYSPGIFYRVPTRKQIFSDGSNKKLMKHCCRSRWSAIIVIILISMFTLILPETSINEGKSAYLDNLLRKGNIQVEKNMEKCVEILNRKAWLWPINIHSKTQEMSFLHKNFTFRVWKPQSALIFRIKTHYFFNSNVEGRCRTSNRSLPSFSYSGSEVLRENTISTWFF